MIKNQKTRTYRSISEFLFRLWAVSVMAVSFSLFAFGALSLTYVIIPLIVIFSSKEKRTSHVQASISLTFSLFIKILHFSGCMRFSFIGFDQLKDEKGTLFLANHPTLIDYVVITSQLRACDNIVKESLWQNFFIKKVIQQAGYIPNIQTEKTLEQIKSAFKKGHNLLVFPEGTRTTHGKEISLKRGSAQIAIRLNAPIRLIHIKCNPPILTKEIKWYHKITQPVIFSVTVGEKIHSDHYLKQHQYPSLAARKLTKDIEKKLQKRIDN